MTLYTILIIALVVALILFLFGRRGL